MTTNKQRSIEMDLQSLGDATASSMYSESQPKNTREQMLANFKEISRIMTQNFLSQKKGNFSLTAEKKAHQRRQNEASQKMINLMKEC